jgi:hypothetical protein
MKAMHRWQFPFKTRQEAVAELDQCKADTGGKPFIKKIVLQAEIYKVFPTEEAYQKYLKRRAKSKGIYVLKTK